MFSRIAVEPLTCLLILANCMIMDCNVSQKSSNFKQYLVLSWWEAIEKFKFYDLIAIHLTIILSLSSGER